MDPDAELVLALLEDPRYRWRTLEAIADELAWDAERVHRAFDRLEDVLLEAGVLDPDGRALYTTRRHYDETTGFGRRLVAAISGKVV